MSLPAERHLGPVLRLIKLQSLLLARSRLRFKIVNPADEWRKAHENRLYAAARFQPEHCSSVVKEVKFHIPSATIKLILTFVIAIRFTHSTLRNRQIRFEER